jgi:uncharacterized protein with von Willebrand factor type A (vWA) domain
MDGSTSTCQRPPAEIAPASPGAIVDGSQVIAHDGYDLDVWRAAVDAYGRLARLTEEATGRLTTALPLARDVFWAAYKAAPRLDPPAPLTPAHELNRQIVAELLGTREWRDVRAAGTVGEPLASAMATIGAVGRVLAALDDETLRRHRELAAAERELAALLGRAEILDDLAAQAEPEKAEALAEQADGARERAAAVGRHAEALREALTAGSEARGDAVRRAARAGLAEAAAEIDAANQAVMAFSGGYGVGPGGGAGQVLTTRDKIAIAQRVAADPKLRQVAAMAGRLTRVAMQIQAARVEHPPDEVTSVALGDDLARVLPGELALLADGSTEDLFWLRLAEKRLLTYQLIGHEPQGKGPIVLAVDNSGSMAGKKEVWSKAVALALLAIAGRQRRDLAVLHFGGSPEELRTFRFARGQASPADTLACIGHFYGGGTEFRAWMQAALRLVDEAAFDRADVLCLSDGLVAIDPATRAAWQERRRARGMRCFGVLIGAREGAGLLAGISDLVLALDLADDGDVLRTIFAI